MDLGWVGMTSVWSEKVRTSRWTSSMTTGGTIGGASGSTLESLRFSDGRQGVSKPTAHNSHLKTKRLLKVIGA